jgi:hypothetical protein
MVIFNKDALKQKIEIFAGEPNSGTRSGSHGFIPKTCIKDNPPT